jgi:hypothetical protein
MSVLQESGSGLTSIIGSKTEVLADWKSNLVRPSLPLAQLHAKFWGISMEGEEKEWRDAQPPMPAAGGELRDKHQHADERTDEDGDDLDDDIIPGCYFLDIGIEGLEYPRIWIRADYIRTYDALENHYQRPAYSHRAPAAVITGEPGIGERGVTLSDE